MTTAGALSRMGVPRQVIVLSISGFFIAVGFGVMVPVLPAFAKQFNVSNFEIGLIISSFAAVRLATSPFSGKIAGKLGERLAISSGMFGVAVSSLLIATAHSYGELLLWRSLGGIGSATFSVAAISLLLSSVGPEKRGEASGMYQGGFLLGGMAGPAIGGGLAGISLTAPFYFYAASVFVAGLICLTMLKPSRNASVGADIPQRKPRPMREVVRDVGYQAACVMAFGQGWQSFGVRSALVPILIVDYLHAGTQATGLAFTVAAVAQTVVLIPTGRAVDRIGRRPLMIFAGIVTAAATLAMPFSDSLWLITTLLCIYGIGAAAQGTAPTAAVGDAARGPGGTPVAIFSMTSDFGAMIGPLIAGWLADHVSIYAAFGAGAAILLSGAVYAMFMPKRIHGKADVM